MTPSAPTGDRPRAWRWWAVAAVTCAALGITSLAVAQHADEVPAPGVAEPRPSTAVREPATRRPAALPAATPERLVIPAIGVATDLLELGLNPDRTVEVPRGGTRAGWFDQGPAPGQPGSSVILGHVDSEDGPAVFYDLKDLDRGDVVRVQLSDATVARFEVVRVATYDNEAFPAEKVYAGSRRHRSLNLVTCGGEYDADAGGYQSNVVVFTRSVGAPTA